MTCYCGRNHRVKEAEYWSEIESILINLPSDHDVHCNPEFVEWIREQTSNIHEYLEHSECYCEGE